eukprot:11211886-Lingulodinium_polyedra.AAC.1
MGSGDPHAVGDAAGTPRRLVRKEAPRTGVRARTAARSEQRDVRRRGRAASCKRGHRWLNSHPFPQGPWAPWLGGGNRTDGPS